jgi:hypothetical protein
VTHEALVNAAAATHAAILVGALALYYKFGDRTDVIAKSLQGTEESIRELRRLIAGDLAETLRADLTPTSSVTTLIVEPANQSYVERPADMFVGERYRDSVRQFVEIGMNRLVDCRNIVSLRDTWIRWARRLSWLILGLVVYELVIAGLLALGDRMGVFVIPDPAIRWAATPTVVLAVLIVTHMAWMHRFHDRITDIRLKYADLSD